MFVRFFCASEIFVCWSDLRSASLFPAPSHLISFRLSVWLLLINIIMQLHTGRFHGLKRTPCGLWPQLCRWRKNTEQKAKKSGAKDDSSGALSGVLPRRVCPLPCGGDEEPGATLPQLPGASRAAAARGEQSGPAPRPLCALENVPEVRDHPGPGERPLHGVWVRGPRQHHPVRARPR